MAYLRELREGSELTYCVRSLRLYSLDKLALPNHWQYGALTCELLYKQPVCNAHSEQGMRLSI